MVSTISNTQARIKPPSERSARKSVFAYFIKPLKRLGAGTFIYPTVETVGYMALYKKYFAACGGRIFF